MIVGLHMEGAVILVLQEQQAVLDARLVVRATGLGIVFDFALVKHDIVSPVHGAQRCRCPEEDDQQGRRSAAKPRELRVSSLPGKRMKDDEQYAVHRKIIAVLVYQLQGEKRGLHAVADEVPEYPEGEQRRF